MPKSSTQAIGKKVRKSIPKNHFSADAELSEHLKQAEHHLIAAIKLFYGPRKVSRRGGYQERLEKAQEAITTLYREELVRIRGPLSKKGSK